MNRRRELALSVVYPSSVFTRLISLATMVVITVGWSVGLRLGAQGPALWLVPGLCLLALAWASWWFRRVTLVAGADGICLVRAFSTSFAPYAALDGIAHVGSGRLAIRLRGAPKILLRAAGPEAAERIDAVLAFIESARVAAPRAASVDLEAHLARGQRTVAEWLRHLESLTTRDGYRGGTVAAEHLWALVENPSLTPPERVAATVALRAHLDDDARARVRVAAQASASPTVRVAIEAALRDDEASLTRALEKLER